MWELKEKKIYEMMFSRKKISGRVVSERVAACSCFRMKQKENLLDNIKE